MWPALIWMVADVHTCDLKLQCHSFLHRKQTILNIVELHIYGNYCICELCSRVDCGDSWLLVTTINLMTAEYALMYICDRNTWHYIVLMLSNIIWKMWLIEMCVVLSVEIDLIWVCLSLPWPLLPPLLLCYCYKGGSIWAAPFQSELFMLSPLQAAFHPVLSCITLPSSTPCSEASIFNYLFICFGSIFII